MTNTTWSTTDKTAGITLSGSNLVTTASAGGNQGVRASDRQVSGKYYWEVTFTVTLNSATGIATGGVALSGVTINLPTTNEVAFVNNTGNIFVNQKSFAVLGSITNGTVVCLALDLDNSRFWIRSGAAGNWNNSATANPATNVGGAAVPFGAILAAYPYDLYTNGSTTPSTHTTNFGDTAFSGTVPSGFTSGFLAGSPTLNAIETQAAIEEWGDGSPVSQVTQVAIDEWGAPTGTSSGLVTSVVMEEWAVSTATVPVTITGVSATAAIGTLISECDVLLSGVSATSAIGILSFADGTVTVIGQSATADLGTLTVISDRSLALTGVAATSQIGTLVDEIDSTVTGVASTSQIGTAVSEIDTPLAGVSASSGIGTPTLQIDSNLSISGVESTTQIGTPISEIDTSLTGVEASASIGMPTILITWFVGQSATAAIGQPIADLNIPVNFFATTMGGMGVAATASVGHPNATTGTNTTDVTITGRTATASVGSLSVTTAVNRSLTGVGATASVGSLNTYAFRDGLRMTDLDCTMLPLTNTKVSLRWSPTKGASWLNPVEQQLGETGQYLTNVQWRRMGIARDMILELSWSADVPTALTGCWLDIEVLGT